MTKAEMWKLIDAYACAYHELRLAVMAIEPSLRPENTDATAESSYAAGHAESAVDVAHCPDSRGHSVLGSAEHPATAPVESSRVCGAGPDRDRDDHSDSLWPQLENQSVAPLRLDDVRSELEEKAAALRSQIEAQTASIRSLDALTLIDAIHVQASAMSVLADPAENFVRPALAWIALFEEPLGNLRSISDRIRRNGLRSTPGIRRAFIIEMQHIVAIAMTAIETVEDKLRRNVP